MTGTTKPPTIPQLISHFNFKANQSPHIDFITYLHDNVTISDIKQIQALTVNQRNSSHWHSYRIGRVTASKAGEILRKCLCSNTNFDPIILELLGNVKDLSNITPVKFGIDSEPVAKQLYFAQYSKTHKGAKMSDIGLCVHNQYPMISGTPDGDISCECCGKGLCECKACYKHRHKSPFDAARDPTYHHVYIDSTNDSKLNRKSVC